MTVSVWQLPPQENNKPTDKELAVAVRECFAKLRGALHAADKAGLRVEFNFVRLEQALRDPSTAFSWNPIEITRPL